MCKCVHTHRCRVHQFRHVVAAVQVDHTETNNLSNLTSGLTHCLLSKSLATVPPPPATAQTHGHKRTHAHAHTHVRFNMHTRANVCLCAHIQVCMRVCIMCTCVQAYGWAYRRCARAVWYVHCMLGHVRLANLHDPVRWLLNPDSQAQIDMQMELLMSMQVDMGVVLGMDMGMFMGVAMRTNKCEQTCW